MADGEVIIDTRLDPSGLEDGLSKLGGLAKTSLQATSVAITAATTALSACATYCVKVGSDFESAFAGVKKTVDATATELEEFRVGILKMSSEIPLAASEIAGIAEAAGQLGIQNENLLDFTRTMADLGVATNMTSEEAATALARLANITGMSQTDFSKLGSTIVALGNNMATTEADIVSMALRLAGTGAQVGLAEDQILALAAAASSVGLEAEAGGSAFSRVMSMMQLAAEQGGTALNAIADVAGMTGGEFKKAFEQDAAGALLAFVDGLGAAEENGKSAIGIISQLGEITELSAMDTITVRDALLRASGASEVFTEALTIGAEAWAANSALANEATQRYETMESRVQLLKNAITALGISAYEDLRGPLSDAVSLTTTMVNQLSTAYDEGGFTGLVTEFGDVLAQIVGHVADAGPQLLEAGANLVHSFCEGIIGAEGIGPAASTLIVSLITAITSGTGDMWSTAITLVGTLAQGIASGLPEIVASASGCVDAILTSIVEQLPILLSAGLQIISTVGEGIISSLPSIGAQGLTILSTLFDSLMVGLPQIAEIGIGLIDTLTSSIASGLPQLIPQAMQAIVSFSATLRENVGLLVDSGLAMIQALAGSLISNIPTFLATVPTIITNLCGCINDNAPKLLATGIDLIIQLAMGLVAAIPDLIDAIPQIIEAIVSVFSAFNWLDLGSKIIKLIGDGIKALATHLPDLIKKIGQTAKDCFANVEWGRLGTNVITWIANGISNLAQAIPKLLLDIGKQAINGIKSVDWVGLGSSLIKGMAAGVANAASSLVNAAVNAASSAIQRVKSWLGINSPSRRARDEIGKHILPGVGQGIVQTSPELNETMEDAASDMLNSFDTQAEDIDVSGLVAKMKQTVADQVGSISTNVAVKTRTGSGQVEGTADENLDYEQLGDAVARGIVRADIKVECDERDFGRLVSDLESD